MVSFTAASPFMLLCGSCFLLAGHSGLASFETCLTVVAWVAARCTTALLPAWATGSFTSRLSWDIFFRGLASGSVPTCGGVGGPWTFTLSWTSACALFRTVFSAEPPVAPALHSSNASSLVLIGQSESPFCRPSVCDAVLGLKGGERSLGLRGISGLLFDASVLMLPHTSLKH